jgi:hypothetical protein
MSLWAKRNVWLKSANLHIEGESKTASIRTISFRDRLAAVALPLGFLGFLPDSQVLEACP